MLRFGHDLELLHLSLGHFNAFSWELRRHRPQQPKNTNTARRLLTLIFMTALAQLLTRPTPNFTRVLRFSTFFNRFTIRLQIVSEGFVFGLAFATDLLMSSF